MPRVETGINTQGVLRGYLMEKIRVIDACMGRGKSSAAIRYMNEHASEKRFLYITPYLDEVDRICDCCDFDQSDGEYMSKYTQLKINLQQGRNVAATHALFHLIKDDALEIIREKGYSLIIDESLSVIEKVQVTKWDFETIVGSLATVDQSGAVKWNDSEYKGKYSECKELADRKRLYCLDGVLFNIMNPELITSFDDVVMLTYLFNGQIVRGYLDYFGIGYNITGIESDEHGFRFSDEPESPGAADYSDKIKIVTDRYMNEVGSGRNTLSKNWYERRSYNSQDITRIRKYLRKFFRDYETKEKSGEIMWTSFKSARDKIIDRKTKRFNNSFLQISARATNAYRDRTRLAYLANRFIDPNILKWFSKKDIAIDADEFALSEMLQWIWRSAIRDGETIDLYIPSERMRNLLTKWMNRTGNGGE